MDDLLTSVIKTIARSKKAWCRYITANDTGKTGGHQAGFYVPKCAASLLFDEPGRKGENKEKIRWIIWQDDFTTESRMKYYGQGTRNEYRITRFGRLFPFLEDEYIGSLLVLAKLTEEDYSAYVLSSDDDIEDFHAYFNLSPTDTNKLIDAAHVSSDAKLNVLLKDYVGQIIGFPSTERMSLFARECYNQAYAIKNEDFAIVPDNILLSWIDTEYHLFKLIEDKEYSERLKTSFDSVDDFVRVANEVLNRRKSRAGKSLEHHLSEIFTRNELLFEEQALTEGRKRPDFLFPNSKCYQNIEFPTDDIIVLGAKTTCKDRWRQVLSEADRVENKYLFTLQQGISAAQLKEMIDSKVTLVVPKAYISSFPKQYQNELKDLAGFIHFVKGIQAHMPKVYCIKG